LEVESRMPMSGRWPAGRSDPLRRLLGLDPNSAGRVRIALISRSAEGRARGVSGDFNIIVLVDGKLDRDRPPCCQSFRICVMLWYGRRMHSTPPLSGM